MREIIFRGKQQNDGEWAYGLLTIDDFITTNGIERAYCIKEIPSDIGSGFKWVMVIPETVGQYTGLIDKNGTKIFEGDIINASNEWWDAAGYAGHDSPIILVEWNEFDCGFAPFSTYDSDCGVSINANGCEVIGNIYDNSEIEWCN